MYCRINRSQTKIKILKYINLRGIRGLITATDQTSLINFATISDFSKSGVIVLYCYGYLGIQGEEYSFKSFIKHVLQNRN